MITIDMVNLKLLQPKTTNIYAIVKNDVFVAKICKYVLYESSEGLFYARRKPANFCHPANVWTFMLDARPSNTLICKVATLPEPPAWLKLDPLTFFGNEIIGAFQVPYILLAVQNKRIKIPLQVMAEQMSTPTFWEWMDYLDTGTQPKPKLAFNTPFIPASFLIHHPPSTNSIVGRRFTSENLSGQIHHSLCQRLNM